MPKNDLDDLNVIGSQITIALRFVACKKMPVFNVRIEKEFSIHDAFDQGLSIGRQMSLKALTEAPFREHAHMAIREAIRISINRVLIGKNPNVNRKNRDRTLVQFSILSLWLHLNHPVQSEADELHKTLLWHLKTNKSARVTIAQDERYIAFIALVTHEPPSSLAIEMALREAWCYPVTGEWKEAFARQQRAEPSENIWWK